MRDKNKNVATKYLWSLNLNSGEVLEIVSTLREAELQWAGIGQLCFKKEKTISADGENYADIVNKPPTDY